MIFPLPRPPFLYPILDPKFSPDLLRDAQHLIRAGIRILQLRVKQQSKRSIYETALRLSDLCFPHKVCLVLNDYADIALVTPVSGLHLGQEDFPVGPARLLLETKIIGLSTHTPEQFEVAQKSAADYIAIGPIFETPTKRSQNSALGIKNIAALLKNKTKPVVAIGGIREQHLTGLLHAGVDGIALISELYRARDIYGTASRLLDQIRKYEKV